MDLAHLGTGADAAGEAAVASSDLKRFLQGCPEDEVEALARLIVSAYGPKYPRDRHLLVSLEERELRGHQLIRDIADDLVNHGSYSTSSYPTYRAIVASVCERHGIPDDGRAPVADAERRILLKYDDCLGAPAPVKDRGSDSARHRLLPSMVSPNWNVVTAAVLRIGVMRVVNWARWLRATAVA